MFCSEIPPRGPDEPAHGAVGFPALLLVFIATATVAMPFTTASAEPLFPAPFYSFEVSYYTTYSVAVGDLDGDGTPDLAVASGAISTGKVTVLLGNGDGTVGTRYAYGVGNTPRSVVIGDLDGDGTLDLVVANSESPYVSVLLGAGNGTFGARSDYATGGPAYSAALGDLNADGALDLVVATYSTGKVAVLLGNGDGTFGARTDYSAGSYPCAVAIGDLSGDAKPDLAVVNELSNTASVLLGNGDGTFAAKNDYATFTKPRSVAIADLNADGKQDLAVATYYGRVSVLLGNGDGTLGAKSDVPTTDGAGSVAVGDLNADGVPDLALGCDGGIAVLLGAGNGTLGASSHYPGGGNYSVAIGDLNGDGKPDLAGTKSSSNVGVLVGNGDGTFGTTLTFGTGNYPVSIAVGDQDGNGTSDLAVANWESNTVSLLRGNGNGTFAAKTDYATGVSPNAVETKDLNGDGRLDLVVLNAGSNTVSVRLGTGGGAFGTRSDYGTGNAPYSMAIGDLNGDGKPDIVTANMGTYPDYYDESVSVRLGTGTGTFGAKTDLYAGPRPISVAIGDLTGDGKPDLVAVNQEAWTLSVLPGNGNGTFAARLYTPTTAMPGFVSVGDVNGDLKRELVVGYAGGYSLGDTYYPGAIEVFLGDFSRIDDYSDMGWFAGGSRVISTGQFPRAVAVGDIDGDGRADLATANYLEGTVSVLLADGSGSFGSRFDYGAGNGYDIALADLNGDGRSDLVGPCMGLNSVAVLLNQGGDPNWSAETPLGTDVVTQLGPSAGVTFASVSGAGQTTLLVQETGPALPAGLAAVADVPRYNELSTTATFAGPVTVRMTYDTSAVIPDLPSVVLMHYDTTLVPPAWVDITTGRDSPSRSVWGVTASLSPFMLMQPQVGAGVEDAVPMSFQLKPCAPNPVTGAATIRFALPVAARVQLDIFDAQGRRVCELVRGELLVAGSHSAHWDVRAGHGKRVSPGIYMARLEAGAFRQTRRIVVLN